MSGKWKKAQLLKFQETIAKKRLERERLKRQQQEQPEQQQQQQQETQEQHEQQEQTDKKEARQQVLEDITSTVPERTSLTRSSSPEKLQSELEKIDSELEEEHVPRTRTTRKLKDDLPAQPVIPGLDLASVQVVEVIKTKILKGKELTDAEREIIRTTLPPSLIRLIPSASTYPEHFAAIMGLIIVFLPDVAEQLLMRKKDNETPNGNSDSR